MFKQSKIFLLVAFFGLFACGGGEGGEPKLKGDVFENASHNLQVQIPDDTWTITVIKETSTIVELLIVGENSGGRIEISLEATKLAQALSNEEDQQAYLEALYPERVAEKEFRFVYSRVTITETQRKYYTLVEDSGFKSMIVNDYHFIGRYFVEVISDEREKDGGDFMAWNDLRSHATLMVNDGIELSGVTL